MESKNSPTSYLRTVTSFLSDCWYSMNRITYLKFPKSINFQGWNYFLPKTDKGESKRKCRLVRRCLFGIFLDYANSRRWILEKMLLLTFPWSCHRLWSRCRAVCWAAACCLADSSTECWRTEFSGTDCQRCASGNQSFCCVEIIFGKLFMIYKRGLLQLFQNQIRNS